MNSIGVTTSNLRQRVYDISYQAATGTGRSVISGVREYGKMPRWRRMARSPVAPLSRRPSPLRLGPRRGELYQGRLGNEQRHRLMKGDFNGDGRKDFAYVPGARPMSGSPMARNQQGSWTIAGCTGAISAADYRVGDSTATEWTTSPSRVGRGRMQAKVSSPPAAAHQSIMGPGRVTSQMRMIRHRRSERRRQIRCLRPVPRLGLSPAEPALPGGLHLDG